MRRISRYLAAAAALVACLTVVATPSFAAPARPGKGAAQVELLAQASNPCGGSPYACADGTFDAWNGDTGGRCEWVGNAPTLGACTNKDYLVANFGYQCAGCDWIRLFWGSNYSGAYFCIPPGYVYGQATSPGLTFNKGAGRKGFGETIWYNAASASWSGPC